MPNNYGFASSMKGTLQRMGIIPPDSMRVTTPTGQVLTGTEASDWFKANPPGKIWSSVSSSPVTTTTVSPLTPPTSQTPTPQGVPTPDTSAVSTSRYSGANNYSLTPQANVSNPSSGSIYDPSNDPWGLNEYLNLGNLNPAGGTGKGNQFFNQQWFA